MNPLYWYSLIKPSTKSKSKLIIARNYFHQNWRSFLAIKNQKKLAYQQFIYHDCYVVHSTPCLHDSIRWELAASGIFWNILIILDYGKHSSLGYRTLLYEQTLGNILKNSFSSFLILRIVLNLQIEKLKK